MDIPSTTGSLEPTFNWSRFTAPQYGIYDSKGTKFRFRLCMENSEEGWQKADEKLFSKIVKDEDCSPITTMRTTCEYRLKFVVKSEKVDCFFPWHVTETHWQKRRYSFFPPRILSHTHSEFCFVACVLYTLLYGYKVPMKGAWNRSLSKAPMWLLSFDWGHPGYTGTHGVNNLFGNLSIGWSIHPKSRR